MKPKTERKYSEAEIELAWRKFKRSFVYRALVRGEWEIVETVEEGKALGATRIDMKRAKDVIEFPEYLRTVAK